MTDDTGEVTRLLDAIAAGDPAAMDRLLPRVYDELRRLARMRMAGERDAHEHQPTSLVHEAYLRLVGNQQARFENRAHFFGAAGEAMRRILVDRARARGALKRGGDRKQITLEDQAAGVTPPADDVLEVDRVLQKLESKDPTMAVVVKLRYFVGLTVEETADALDTSPRTVNRQWTAASAWLQRELKRG